MPYDLVCERADGTFYLIPECPTAAPPRIEVPVLIEGEGDDEVIWTVSFRRQRYDPRFDWWIYTEDQEDYPEWVKEMSDYRP